MSSTTTRTQQLRTAGSLPAGAVFLRRVGQYLRLEPAVRGLEKYLYTVRHVPVNDAGHGLHIQKQLFPLIWPQKGARGVPCSLCYAGLEPLVKELLMVAGLDVIPTGERPAALPSPNEDALSELEAVDSLSLDLVRGHDRGLIGYDPTHVEPARLVAQVALAWPKRKVVVVTTRVNDARAFRKELEKHLGKVALFTGEHHPARGTRVVVATPNRLGDGALGIEKRSLCFWANPAEIFTSADPAVMNPALDGIQRLWRARVYGLLADDVRPSPWQWSLLTALFGLEGIHIPRHGHRDLPVAVVFSKICGGERPPDGKDNLALKRIGIWKHPLRNRRIAALFLALATQDRKTLREKFPDVAGHVRGRLGGRVGLLVEGVEHGLALAALLPGVPLVTGLNAFTPGLPAHEDAIVCQRRPFRNPAAGCAIVTVAGLDRAEQFEVLVRADGGRGLPELPETSQAVAKGDESALLLIDFRDEHHPVLRKWSRERRGAYIGAGWNLLTGAPSLWERFLAFRPEVNA